MCPDECPGLADAVGDAFVELYTKYETAGLGHKTMKARDLWFQVLDAQMETGTPYLCFKDAANKKSNQQNLGTIKSSNLCVAPETMVLTDHGHVEIQTLAGQQVNVWNGHEFSEVTVVQTGTDEELMEVETDDGCKLTCTPYHKFFVGPDHAVVEAQHLRPGDVLTTCELPTLGQSVAIKMEWFTEFCAACAYTMEDSHTELILGSNPTDLLLAKYILQTCGVHVAIHENGYILLNSSVIQHLIQLGIELPWPMDSPIDLDQGPSVSQLGPVRIKRTRKIERRDATYCFTEPKRSAAVFNGIYTSQCSEIIQYSSPTETAVCNLASIALPAFVRKDTEGKASIDYEKLHAVTKIVTYNLNRVIDVNYYPTPKTQLSNMRHRPIGIGVQGLADVFMMMDLAFTSEEAQTLNRHIFETIYHGALEQSCDLAEVEGAYETFAGSPASKGLLQFDLWNSNSNNHSNERYDWTALKTRIQAVGLRNSLLLAPMPTASTSQILGYNECIEPITSNIYNRRTLAGEFILANKYLMHDLIQLDLWNDKMKNAIIANNGSVQSIETIPQHIRDKYKTVWELPMRKLIDMAADRGVYICQSQSLNLWLEDPTYNSLTSMHFYSWSKGLKTGIYYLRRRARHHAQQFTIEPTKVAASSSGDEEICEMCSA
jgi:ribonucleotide reductase alpha subunit